MAIARKLPALLAGTLIACGVAGKQLPAERPLALNELQAPAAKADAKAESDADPKRDRETKPRLEAADASNDTKSISSADEAAALAFVKEHHAELANLLRVLRSMNEPQYRNAIRDLARTRQRLEQLRPRSEERYQSELQAWKVKSHIELLTARLHMTDTPELRKELLQAYQRQSELRRSALQAERDRLAERLSKLDEQMDRLENSPATNPEHQLETLLSRIAESKRTSGKSNRPAKGEAGTSERPAKPTDPTRRK